MTLKEIYEDALVLCDATQVTEQQKTIFNTTVYYKSAKSTLTS